MNPEEQSSDQGVVLVIGAGGVKCAAALGLWKVFQREGIGISLSVGCSGGSLYAPLIALGLDVHLAEQMTLRFWTGDIMRGYTANLRDAQSGARRFDERSGLVDDGPLMEALGDVFGDVTFEQTRIPLHLVATDFYSGERVIISSGRLLDAVRSSIAIPTIFPPWEMDGRLLVDGAASDPLPVDVAIKEGGRVIVAMGFELPMRSRMGSLAAVNSHLNNIYVNNLLRASFAFHNLAHYDEIVPIVPQFGRSISAMDPTQIPYVIEEGERAATEQLPYLRRLLSPA